MRWNDYILTKGTNQCNQFWEEYLAAGNRDIFYILGIGFDPRTTDGISTIYSLGGNGKRDALLLRYYQSDDEKSQPSDKRVQQHEDEVKSLLTKADGTFSIKPLVVRSGEDRSIASIRAYEIVDDINTIKEYSDVVVDISAMPRAIFMPLLNKLLALIDDFNVASQAKINLHVIVSENFKLDNKIEDDGKEQSAEFIHGLGIQNTANTQDFKEVWVAVLGEKQMDQFSKIKSSINPVSTCIVLPFPSNNLRRGDDLMVYYKDGLLNDDDFDVKNIIYGDEQNPFQVYRLIKKTIDRYFESFQLLGGCKVVVSALSSKLLTIGAFLAIFEAKGLESIQKLRVGIKHVESISHKFDEDSAKQEGVLTMNELFHLWIAGDPYFPND
ncbi:hypothetical protein [Niabella hibiscisoli]|uniref:hypothetical protein n=1 Tax=Niabella hibiscisoli TaxID=1825928 RepID=UPI001F1173E8|nr:hypothetical protein [Niabella hibiscisoli]MCH5717775.1 hypothetical protein [Niabella hibiscisoli]